MMNVPRISRRNWKKPAPCAKKHNSFLLNITASARKRKKKAGDIVAAAEREAKALLEDAKRATEEYVVRRNKLAEQKIATAETDAINAVRASAVDLAVAAAGKIVADKVDAKVAGTLFKDALGQVKTNLN